MHIQSLPKRCTLKQHAPLILLALILALGGFALARIFQARPVSATGLQATNGTTYYVATTGSDSNPGTASQPFRTIQKGIASAGPGDTILVRAGTYDSQYASATYGHAEWNANAGSQGGQNGAPGAPVTLLAEHPATESPESQRTVLVGDGSGFGIFVTDAQHIVIDGLEITNFEVGIGLHEGSSYITVRRSILRSNTSAGIECAPCSDSLFEYNAFVDPGPAYPDLDDAIQDYGLNFYAGSANNTVVHNYFFGKHNQALSWKRRSGPGYAAYNTFEGFMYTALYLGQNDDEAGEDMTSFDVTVEYNVFRDATDGETGVYYRGRSPITIRNIQNAVVRYNYIENMFGAAIYVRSCEGGYYCQTSTGKRPVGAKIYGNTIVNGWNGGDPGVPGPPDSSGGGPVNPPAFYITGRGYTNDAIEILNNTIVNTNQAFVVAGTPDYVSNRETGDPPVLTITNNNLVNVGPEGLSFVDGATAAAATFAFNNWYELDNPSTDNRQGASDMLQAPAFVGPLTSYTPQPGPNFQFDPDFSRAQAYRLQATSPLIDAGTDVGLAFQGSAPDVGSNEFIPTGSLPTPTPTSSPGSTPPGSTATPTPPSATATPTPAPGSAKPYPAGDEMPFGWAGCKDMARCRDDGFTVIHRAYWGNIDSASASQWAQDAMALGIEKNFVNTTPFDLMRSNPLSQQYDLWKNWFQGATQVVPPWTILGYYLPDEPEPSQGEYDKVNEIMRALKDVDPEALGILYDGGVDPNTLKTILGTVGPGIDVLLDGGYPIHHPEYGGPGWVYGRLREIEATVKSFGKTIWIVTEGFDEACARTDTLARTKHQFVMGILGGAQGVMTYSYAYSFDNDCYVAHQEFLPVYRTLWPWIKAANRQELPVTVTSGPAKTPVYNLSQEVSFTSVVAWLFTDEGGRIMLGTVNLLDDAAVGATVSGLPKGTWQVVEEGRSVTVGDDGLLADSWAPLGYHFYILDGVGSPPPSPTVTPPPGSSPTPTPGPGATPTPAPTTPPTPDPNQEQTLHVTVADTFDDADASEEALDPTDDEINVPSWSRGFMRFQVNLPAGAQVTGAYLKVRTLSQWSGQATAQLRRLDTSNASAFTGGNPFDAPTQGEVIWQTGAAPENTWVQSVDIGSLVQAFVDLPDYRPGNYIGIVWAPTESSADRNIWSYDGGHPPTLVVTYRGGSGANLSHHVFMPVVVR